MTATDEREASTPTLWLRLGIGVAQGLVAWLLIDSADKAFAKDHPQLFAALVLVTAFPPLILLAGLGRMRARVLLAWSVLAAAVLAGLAAYDLWRDPFERLAAARHWPSVQLAFFGAAALYIAHHLIEPADRERRWAAGYQGRFEDAWRHGFQLALAIAFTAVFWGVLRLGGALFALIGVKGFDELLSKTWFISPVTAAAFAGAVHLTDVRPGLIRGVRTVGLTLLSWLLPLMAALTAAFLVALVFTGVEPLWGTRRAAALLLSAAAALIVLLNTAYQDGLDRETLPRALRWAGRGAAVLLVPLTALAAWATALRIGQYGLTTERVVSVAVLVIATVYAVGYAWAALSRGPWMKRVETVNVAAAAAVLAAILLLLSPVLDPARLAVADQVGRLEGGATSVETFDFKYLRFNAGRFGTDALARLARSRDPKVAQQARLAQADTERYGRRPSVVGVPFSGAVVRPAEARLPESFRSQVFTPAESQAVECLRGAARCELYPRDLNGDGSAEVLVSQGSTLAAFALGSGGRWTIVGRYEGARCEGVPEALAKGEIRPVPSRFNDLEIAGQRLTFNSDETCESEPKPAPPGNGTAPGGLGPAFGGL